MAKASVPRQQAQPESSEDSCEWFHRDRIVGRWQRAVRWVLIENIIWVDWREVRSGRSNGMLPDLVAP